MMKNMLKWGLIGAVACAAMTVSGAEPAQPAAEAVATPSAVAAAMKGVQVLSGEVNPNAQVYFYLHSAGWCGPCCAAMPGIVELYKEMKADGRAEIILISYDKSPEGAKKYAESYQAEMPTVHAGDKGLLSLPSFAHARGIPAVAIIRADGEVIGYGAPSRIAKWKELVK